MPFRTDAPLVGVDEFNLTHQERSVEVHKALEQAVYAAHYGDVRDAVSDALEKGRPLELKTGAVYDFDAALNITNAPRLHIIGNDATLRAAADMACLLDLNGIAYSSAENLNLTTVDGITVQDMIRYRWDGIPARSTTQNTFERVRVGGQYVNGWRIGEPGSALQCDSTAWRQCSVVGGWTPGENTLWQRGAIVGGGVFGNNMAHTFTDGVTQHNRVHFEIDKARHVQISGIAGYAETDILARAWQGLHIHDWRSEGSRQLLKLDIGGTTLAMAVEVNSVSFNASPNSDAITQPDLRWIETNYGGYLGIRNAVIRLAAEDRHGVIYGRNLQRPLYIEARGLQVVNTAQADAFDVTGATVDVGGYFQIANAGGIVV